MSKVGEHYRELEEMGIDPRLMARSSQKPQRNKCSQKPQRNKFAYGFAAACVIILLSSIFISCSVATLEANGSDCGESWNPCYVRIVE